MSATFTVDTERISAASADIGQISAEIETQVGAMMGRLTALQDAWQGSASAGFQGVIAQWRGTQSQVRESLESINRLLQQATRRYDKTLFTTQKPGGERPAVVAARDDRTEARFVAQMVLHRREAGVPLARMAVLFRSAFHSFELEVELARRGIPFVKFGGMKLSEAVDYFRAVTPRVAVPIHTAIASEFGLGLYFRQLQALGPEGTAFLVLPQETAVEV